MIIKTLKTTQGKLKISIPESLEEITLAQLIALQDKPDVNDLDAISILSGIPVEALQNVMSITELQAFSEPVLTLAQQIKYMYNSDAIPQKVTFHLASGTKTVKVSNNLAVEPAGAFMAARDIITDEINEHIKLYGEGDWQQNYNPSLKVCCHVLAHYFYCKVTGKPYNEYEADEFTAEIKKLRVTEALPISKHFFTCYPNLSKQKTSFWHRLLPFLKKERGSNLSKSLSISTP